MEHLVVVNIEVAMLLYTNIYCVCVKLVLSHLNNKKVMVVMVAVSPILCARASDFILHA